MDRQCNRRQRQFCHPIQHLWEVNCSWLDRCVDALDVENAVRAGFGRDNAHSDAIGLVPGTSNAASYGLTGIPAGEFDEGILPINISGLQRLGTAPWRPQVQVSQVWHLLDTLSWLKGNHSFKFGYEFRHESNNFLDAESPGPNHIKRNLYGQHWPRCS